MGWIGVDLDGTLAETDHGAPFNPCYIGPPCPPDELTGISMVDMVKKWLAEGKDVRVFTARACGNEADVLMAIQAWCEKHIGRILLITNQKDYDTIEIYDDRAVQVGKNTSKIIGYSVYGNHT